MTVTIRTPLTQREAMHLANYTPVQAAKARQCLAARGIQPTAHRGEFYVTASDGKHAYLTTTDACTCHAGTRRLYCWHRAAVVLRYLCAHEAIDPHERVCGDCGAPATDEQCDAESERRFEQIYGRL